MKLEGSFSSLLLGRPPLQSHSTAVLFRENSTSNDCKRPQWMGPAPRGLLNYLTLPRSPFPATESIFLLSENTYKGSQVPFETMAKGAKKGKGQMIYLYGHLVDENFHVSCHYQSTGKTEEGEAVGKVGNEVKRDSSGTNSLATEGSEINTRSAETSTVNRTVTLQCSGSGCLNEDPPGPQNLSTIRAPAS